MDRERRQCHRSERLEDKSLADDEGGGVREWDGLAFGGPGLIMKVRFVAFVGDVAGDVEPGDTYGIGVRGLGMILLAPPGLGGERVRVWR